ncbi:MAG: hypothetical protein AAGA56_11405, partial [Myxococcota bacterium]
PYQPVAQEVSALWERRIAEMLSKRNWSPEVAKEGGEFLLATLDGALLSSLISSEPSVSMPDPLRTAIELVERRRQ